MSYSIRIDYSDENDYFNYEFKDYDFQVINITNELNAAKAADAGIIAYRDALVDSLSEYELDIKEVFGYHDFNGWQFGYKLANVQSIETDSEFLKALDKADDIAVLAGDIASVNVIIDALQDNLDNAVEYELLDTDIKNIEETLKELKERIKNNQKSIDK